MLGAKENINCSLKSSISDRRLWVFTVQRVKILTLNSRVVTVADHGSDSKMIEVWWLMSELEKVAQLLSGLNDLLLRPHKQTPKIRRL